MARSARAAPTSTSAARNASLTSAGLSPVVGMRRLVEFTIGYVQITSGIHSLSARRKLASGEISAALA